VNGDGYADAAVGSPRYDNGNWDEGCARVYLGSATGLGSAPDWSAEGNQDDAWFGRSVGTAGDVNGDGYADLVVGAYSYSAVHSRGGRALVFYGNDGPGPSLKPQQRRVDDSAPVSPLGMSDAWDGFLVSVLGRSPFGRGNVRLEYEVKPFGSPFDGTGTTVSDLWTDTGTAGAGLSERVDGATVGERYHWRVRLHYDRATTPFQGAGRWLTVPWNGWQETDLRTKVEADLALGQLDAPDPVLTGVELTYTLDVTNGGPDPADVGVKDELPDGVTFVSATPSQGSCQESGNEVRCSLGEMANGGTATVTIVVTADTVGVMHNAATVGLDGRDPDAANDTSMEETTVRSPALGDRVWEDTDGDGIQDAGEPGMGGVVVSLYDGGGVYLDSTGTDSTGNYAFPGVTYGADYYVQFTPPEGYVLTAQDQGGDDLADSDADPLTWRTPVVSLVDGDDPVRWDAGMIPECVEPDQTVYIYTMTVTDDGNDNPVLHVQDPNQPSQITGYNVYRSSDASMPPGEWPLEALDEVDMDESEPDIQWVDGSGDESPTRIWCYDVAAYNHRCPAEGPR
jgi:uncharacterized repeat protein (TIGR01451 family)